MHRNLWIEVDKSLLITQHGLFPFETGEVRRLVAGGRWPRPPPAAGLAGATVAALNTYKKNFLKNLLH